MPANIDTMFSAAQTPWHKLGVVVPEGLKSAEAIRVAGLGWQAAKEVVYTKVGNLFVPIPRQYAIVRKDNNTVLSNHTVGNGYTIFQNNSAFEFADAFIESGDARYETAGSLCGGKRVWMLMKIDGTMRVNKTDDIISKYLFITNGHDGVHTVELGLTSVRIVCANTLELALAEAKKTGNIFRMRHSANVKDRIQEAKDALGLVNKQFTDFNELINEMANMQMSKKSVEKFMKAVGLDEKENPRDKETIEQVIELFETGKGNTMKGVKGSLWGLVNGFTEYVDWKRGTRQTKAFTSVEEARLNSAWFGSGRELKNEALEQAVELLRA